MLLTLSGLEEVSEVPGWSGTDWVSLVQAGDQPAWEPLTMPGPLTGGSARGGSSILKYQALCPFRSFAANRLAAEGMESPADGISARLHGSLVHQVLELFWKETRTLANLLELSEEQVSTRVRGHVDEVVANEIFLKQRPGFARVEADRLTRQALACLALDREREPFTVIEFEKEVHPQIEGQAIRLFIDRIDRTPEGETIIIDYKTGQVSPGKWFDDRPEDPQLPLYAISSEDVPAAVAFSIIRDDGCEYKGIVTREGLLTGLPANRGAKELKAAGENMALTVDNWRRVLHRLMASFLAGEATVDPKNGRSTCRNSFCELQPLCRIDELETRAQALPTPAMEPKP
jgi:RecB family exonuclease